MIKNLSYFKSRKFDQISRSLVIANNAMVVSSHPIASSTGIEILKNGGNAVDAALAMNAVLCIAEPHMTGVGGDCFAMISKDGGNKIRALNGSGKSPAKINTAYIRERKINTITSNMPEAITVPGAVSAWVALHKYYGHMPWKLIFDPAINYASKGIRVHERVATDWNNNIKKLSIDEDTSNIFLKNKNAFHLADNFKNLNLAKTFETISTEGFNGFYNGWIAQDMVEKLNSIGGKHTLQDFSSTKAEWVEPISGNYRGFEIHECPPNGQGLVALIILAILEKFNFGKFSKCDYIHIFCEATKIAYFLRNQYLADPQFNKLSINYFLNKKIISEFASKIDMNKAKMFGKYDFPNHPDTIYLAVRDKNGMTISFINSLFDAFGSGITALKSGVLFHCRGRAFNLIKGHPNELKPNKRPAHTIIPAMISKDGKLIGAFGVMGGQYQSAGHAFVLSKMLDFGLNPQEAINHPRVFPNENFLDIERSFDKNCIEELEKKGHKINFSSQPIGGAQMIIFDEENGSLIGASDWRKDGLAIGY